MKTSTHTRTKIFVSYSRRDQAWLDRLRIHLKPLERIYKEAIDVWDDTRIKPGDRWREAIKQALETASIAVLLFSADFLASDFIATEELPPLLNAAEKDGALILPIILSPCGFHRAKYFSELQPVNDPSKPLILLPIGEQEKVFSKAAEDIEDALTSLKSRSLSQSVSTERLIEQPSSEKKAIHFDTHGSNEPYINTMSIARVPNNDLGFGIMIGGSYAGHPLEVVASPWSRHGETGYIMSGWLYASPYYDFSHAVAFFKSRISDDGEGYIHILDSSNPIHMIKVTTMAGFGREEKFCWDDSNAQRTALWKFSWKP